MDGADDCGESCEGGEGGGYAWAGCGWGHCAVTACLGLEESETDYAIQCISRPLRARNGSTYAIDGRRRVMSVARSWVPDSCLPRLERFGFWFPRDCGCCFLIRIDDRVDLFMRFAYLRR